jgi:hypothetical protein
MNFTNVLIAVVGQAFADALDAVSDIGWESLPLLHDFHQLAEQGSARVSLFRAGMQFTHKIT